MIFAFKIRRVSIPLVSDTHVPSVFGSLSRLRKGKYSDCDTAMVSFLFGFLSASSFFLHFSSFSTLDSFLKKIPNQDTGRIKKL